MAYDTSTPPIEVVRSRDGSTPSVWSYATTDGVAAITAADYISDAGNLGMLVGDFVLVRDTDNASAPVLCVVSALSSGAGTLTLANRQEMTAGTGITTGTGTVYESAVERIGGNLVRTTIFVDVTGLNSSAAGDIIGKQATANCHLGQITAAVNGTIVAGTVKCLETPLTGEPDIDLGAGDEATGTEDEALSGLTNSATLLAAAADWTVALVAKPLTSLPAADQYLYLAGSGGGTDATYTAGKFEIVLYGTT